MIYKPGRHYSSHSQIVRDILRGREKTLQNTFHLYMNVGAIINIMRQSINALYI